MGHIKGSKGTGGKIDGGKRRTEEQKQQGGSSIRAVNLGRSQVSKRRQQSSKFSSAKHANKNRSRQSWHSRESAGCEKRWFSWLRSSSGRSQIQKREQRDFTQSQEERSSSPGHQGVIPIQNTEPGRPSSPGGTCRKKPGTITQLRRVYSKP